MIRTISPTKGRGFIHHGWQGAASLFCKAAVQAVGNVPLTQRVHVPNDRLWVSIWLLSTWTLSPAMTGEVSEQDTHWSGVLTALALARCGCEYLKCLAMMRALAKTWAPFSGSVYIMRSRVCWSLHGAPCSLRKPLYSSPSIPSWSKTC